jgi:hypothetical protein
MAGKVRRYISLLGVAVGILAFSLFSLSCFNSLQGPDSTSPAIQPSSQNPEKGTRARLSPSRDTVNPGDTFQVVVVINTGTAGISSGDVTVSFNSNAFQALDIKAGPLLGPEPLVGSKLMDNSRGSVELAIARVGTTHVSSIEAGFATINFLVTKSASLGSHQFSLKADLADQNFQVVKAEVTGANISILSK